METGDFLIIGAGIAGASAAFELAAHGRVVLVERESQPGYHATGRSAALYTRTYGHAVVRALAAGAWDFLGREATETGFADHPLLTPRGVLLIGRADQEGELDAAFAEGGAFTPTLERLDGAGTLRRAPVLRPDYVAGAVWEPEAMDIDVHALHTGFLKGLRARGGRLITGADVVALARRDGLWRAETTAGRFNAPVLVNAAGAWADAVAALAHVVPVGLVPKRRTAILFDPALADGPPAGAPGGWPMVIDIAEQFYVKPDAGRVMASPGDETPVAPCDAQPEELDVACAVDRIERATRFRVRRIGHKWAGLRSFVADKVPVAGYDDGAEGFFWLAGQGGYGIKTAPALARLAAALATGGTVPADLAALGVTAAALAPGRLRGPGRNG